MKKEEGNSKLFQNLASSGTYALLFVVAICVITRVHLPGYWTEVITFVVIGLSLTLLQVKQSAHYPKQEIFRVQLEENEKKEKGDKVEKIVLRLRERIRESSWREEDWSDVCFVADYYEWKFTKFPKVIIEAITTKPLKGLVTISAKRKQIVWCGDLESILFLLEKIYTDSFMDEAIDESIKQVEKLKEHYWQRSYREFKGFNLIVAMINNTCPTIMHAIN